MSLRRALPLLLISGWLFSCGTAGSPTDLWNSVCGDVSCGSGRCVVDGERAACLCEPGFVAEGLSCVETVTELCAADTCTELGRTVCVVEGSSARCECDAGLTEVDGFCLTPDACAPNPCAAPFSECTSVLGEAQCGCPAGHAVEGEGCSETAVFNCDDQHVTGDAYEPNECPNLATSLLVAIDPVSDHTLAPAGDVDWFSLSTEEGHIYEVLAEAASGVALHADVFDESGLKPIGADYSATSALRVVFKAPSGRAYLRLRALRANETTPYSLVARDLGLDDFPDAPAGALPLGGNSLLAGKLDFPGDADVFQLGTAAAQKVSIQASNTSATDIRLEVLSAEGETLALGAGPAVRHVLWDLEPRTLFLRISATAANALGAYELQVEELGADDHGDRSQDATLLASLPLTTSVQVSPGGDQDFLAVDARKGVVLAISCQNVAGGWSYSTVQVSDSNQVILASGSGYSSPVYVKPSRDERLFFRITSNESSTVPVALDCAVHEAALDDHGDTAGTATPAVADGLPHPSEFEYPLDVDVIQFDVVAPNIYSLNCATSCRITVPGVGSADGSFHWEATVSGTIYAELRPRYSGAAASYTWTLSQLGAEDFGDTTATAAPLTVGGSSAGKIEFSGDVDVFSFPATSGHVYRFRCTTSGGGSCASRIVDQGGAVVATSNSSTDGAWVEAAADGVLYGIVESGYGTYPISYSVSVADLGMDDHADLFTGASPFAGAASLSGTLEQPSDLDFFSFDGVAGTVYRAGCVVPAGVSGHCRARLVDATGALVAEASSAARSEVFYELPTSGTWFVYIASGSSYGVTFPLVYTAVFSEQGTDDHGDTAATASAIAAGDSGTGNIESTGDVDVFSFTATAPQIYRATCRIGTQSCGVEIRGPDGSVVASSTSSYAEGPAFEASVDGTYTVWLRSIYASPPQSYSWSLTDLGVDDFADTGAGATALVVGAPQAGEIEMPRDVDVFVVTAAKGHVYRVGCQPSTALQSCNVSILDMSGYVLATDYSAVAWEFETEGPFHVLVAPGYSERSGAYTVTVTDLGTDDHGDDAASATLLATSTPVTFSGVIESYGDKDTFLATLTGGVSYTLSGSSGVDVAVHTSSGGLVTSGWMPRSFTPTSSGQYVISVYDYVRDFGTAYTVTLQ